MFKISLQDSYSPIVDLTGSYAAAPSFVLFLIVAFVCIDISSVLFYSTRLHLPVEPNTEAVTDYTARLKFT